MKNEMVKTETFLSCCWFEPWVLVSPWYLMLLCILTGQCGNDQVKRYCSRVCVAFVMDR